MKSKKYIKPKKYAIGGTLKPMQTPQEHLFNANRMYQESDIEAQNNPLVQDLNMLGSTLQNTGMSMVQSGISGLKPTSKAGKFMQANSGGMMNMLGALQGFAMGGNVNNNIPVEVEGEEVGEMPNGQMLDFQGASHEKGGIPIALPEGTEIYSKRVKVDGVSMADRKKKREKKTYTLEQLLDKNKSDILLKNSLARTNRNNEIEEDADTKIQQTVSDLLGQEERDLPQHAYKPKVTKRKSILPVSSLTPIGITSFKNPLPVGDISGLKPIVDTSLSSTKEEPSMFQNILGNFTPGDAISMFGNKYQADKVMEGIMQNRAGDTPNINAFKNYGQEGLKTLSDSKQYVKQQQDAALNNLQSNRNASMSNNRKSSRGVNSMRMLDLATDAGLNTQQNDVYNNTASQMMNIMGQQSQLQNNRDAQVMQGEQGRDLADRQDRDNFFNNLQQGHINKGKMISQTGHDLNEMKTRNVTNKLMNRMSPYAQTDISGNKTVRTDFDRKHFANYGIDDNGFDNMSDEQILDMRYKIQKQELLEAKSKPQKRK